MTEELHIDCKYSCGECGIHRAVVSVPARTGETVTDWLEKIAVPHLVADHEARSPLCRPKSFSEVMIPVTGASQIGGISQN
jgi:hypothetical protein